MTRKVIFPEGHDSTLSCDDIFYKYGSPRRRKAAEECIPLHVDLEINNRCTGSCRYCLNSSNPSGELFLPKEKVKEILDDAVDLGTTQILWNGGEPLLHPDIFELMDYAASKGLQQCLFTSGVFTNKKLPKKLAQMPNLHAMAINIDTINQEAYNQVHFDPKGLSNKMQFYHNIIDSGYPPDRVLPSLCLTKPVIDTVDETMDWLIDEMGAKFVFLPIFIPSGYGRENGQWEPSLSDIKRACEYRAKKTTENWIRIGSLDCNVTHCKIKIYINYYGEVLPCNYLLHMSTGNIYRQSLKEIHEKHREMLHFRDLKIKGKCGECENSDVCFGCRGKAYLYLGDETASDPKCWMNPEAKETYLR